MANSLVFPDGVRLSTEDEIPGPLSSQTEAWMRVQSANIKAGYLIKETSDSRYPFYAEINVDAPYNDEILLQISSTWQTPAIVIVLKRYSLSLKK